MLTGTIISFSLSVWAYHAERVFVPIVVVVLILLYLPKINIIKIKKQLIIGGLVLAIFAIPFLKLTIFTPAIKTRAAVTSIFREPSLNSALHRSNYQNFQQQIFDNDLYIIFRHWLALL